MSSRLINFMLYSDVPKFAGHRPEDDVESFVLVLVYALMRNVLETKHDLGLQAQTARDAFEARFSSSSGINAMIEVSDAMRKLILFKRGLSPVLHAWTREFQKHIEDTPRISSEDVEWTHRPISYDVLLRYLDDGITQLSKAQTPNSIPASTPDIRS